MILPILAALFLLVAAPPAGAANPPLQDAVKGRELMASGRYEASLPYFKRALRLAEAHEGPDNPTIATEINDLAEGNRLAGHYDVALSLYQRALKLDQSSGKDQVGYATTLNNQALVYREKGDFDQAVRLHTQSLNILQDALGPTDPRVAMSLHNLAAVYRQMGRVDEARPLEARAVEIADKTLGAKDSDDAKFRAALAAMGKGAATKPEATMAAVERSAPQVPGKSALPPPPLPTPPRHAAALPSGPYQVQVAAVPQADQVPAEWQRLVKHLPDLRGLQLQPTEAVEVKGKGTFYRVFGGPLASRPAAETLCARLKSAGAYCRIVGP